MNTQLLAWEYEGNPEWGFDYGNFFFTSCYSSRQNYTRYKSKVHNLRKVKVVDEDAVVIEKDVIHFDKFLNDVIEVSGSNYEFNYTKSQKVHECAMYLQQKIYPPVIPPVQEPKNFGAIVEASIKDWYDSPRQRWVAIGGDEWLSEDTVNNRKWFDLANPVVKSLGILND